MIFSKILVINCSNTIYMALRLFLIALIDDKQTLLWTKKTHAQMNKKIFWIVCGLIQKKPQGVSE